MDGIIFRNKNRKSRICDVSLRKLGNNTRGWLGQGRWTSGRPRWRRRPCQPASLLFIYFGLRLIIFFCRKKFVHFFVRPSSLSFQHAFISAHQVASISLVSYFVNVEANVWITFSSSIIIRCAIIMISRRQVFYSINYKFTNLKVTILCCKVEWSNFFPPITLCLWVNVWHIFTDILKNIKAIKDCCIVKASPVNIWKKGHSRIHVSDCKVKWRNKSVIHCDYICSVWWWQGLNVEY